MNGVLCVLEQIRIFDLILKMDFWAFLICLDGVYLGGSFL